MEPLAATNPTVDICLDGRDFHGWYLRSTDVLLAGSCDMEGKNRIEYSGQTQPEKG